MIEKPRLIVVAGPNGAGKTTVTEKLLRHEWMGGSLLYKFFAQIQKKQKLDVKFLDLRKTFTNVYEDFLKTFFRVETRGEKKATLTSNINIGFFKINAAVEKKILEKRADPFKVMEAELLKITQKGIKAGFNH